MRRLVNRCALLAAMVGLMLVAGAAPAMAEGDLIIEADAVYELIPDESHVLVTVEYRLTHNKPRSGIYYYYYDAYSFLLPDEATDIVAVDDNGRSLELDDEVMEFDDGTEGRVITAHFARNLYYGKTEVFKIAFQLPGGDPRTESFLRANPAYAAFAVWAWGDPGKSRVEVRIPPEFEVDYAGSPLAERHAEGETTWYRDAIPDPENWYVFFTARNDDALQSQIADVPDIVIDVRSWPGDPSWGERVKDVIERGVPEMLELIGLPFDEDQMLDIVEALDPSLVGYAGWYLLDEDVIEMGEELDDHVVIHEMAHLWFNEELFDSRWINEGLADEFAVVVVDLIEGEANPAYSALRIPVTSRSVAVPLNDWHFPYSAPAGDEEVQKQEEYGYNASYYVIRVLRDEIGTDGMIAVLQAAANDHIAYQDGDPEAVDPEDDWRRFMDLVQELGGSTKVDEVFRDFVVPEDEHETLDDRADAREAYLALMEADGDLRTPMLIREPMSDWEFETARDRIERVYVLLDEFDALLELAATLDITVPPTAMDQYEAAAYVGDLHAGSLQIQRQTDRLQSIIAAKDAVDAERDLFTRVGLRDEDPEADLQAIIDAFEANELYEIPAMSQQLIDLITDARDVGKVRVIWMIVAASGALLLLSGGGTFWFLHRRKKKRAMVDVGPGPEPEAA